MSDSLPDPIRHAAQIIAKAADTSLEKRIKHDIVESLTRIKPGLMDEVDFDRDIMQGDFFAGLSAPLQGIAIAKTEGAIAFYNRVGWHPACLDAPLTDILEAEPRKVLSDRYHAKTLHDLGYVHPKHFEKILGKAGAAAFWEKLKRHIASFE